MHRVDVTFVPDHAAVKAGVPGATHRVVVVAETEVDAMLTAAQMVAARGVFVTDTALVL